MYHASYNPASGCLDLSRNGKYWFSIPAAVTVNEKVKAANSVQFDKDFWEE